MTDRLTDRARQALVRAGYTDPRNGEPSVSALANDLGENKAKISRYFYQGSKMQLPARRKVADALEVSVSDLDSMVKGQRVDTYSPPEAANRLTHRERTLVNDLINLLAERHGKAVGDHAERSAPIDELAQRRADPEVGEHAAFDGDEGIGPSDDPHDT